MFAMVKANGVLAKLFFRSAAAFEDTTVFSYYDEFVIFVVVNEGLSK